MSTPEPTEVASADTHASAPRHPDLVSWRYVFVMGAVSFVAIVALGVGFTLVTDDSAQCSLRNSRSTIAEPTYTAQKKLTDFESDLTVDGGQAEPGEDGSLEPRIVDGSVDSGPGILPEGVTESGVGNLITLGYTGDDFNRFENLVAEFNEAVESKGEGWTGVADVEMKNTDFLFGAGIDPKVARDLMEKATSTRGVNGLYVNYSNEREKYGLFSVFTRYCWTDKGEELEECAKEMADKTVDMARVFPEDKRPFGNIQISPKPETTGYVEFGNHGITVATKDGNPASVRDSLRKGILLRHEVLNTKAPYAGIKVSPDDQLTVNLVPPAEGTNCEVEPDNWWQDVYEEAKLATISGPWELSEETECLNVNGRDQSGGQG